MANIEISRLGTPANPGGLLLAISATPGVHSEPILAAFGQAGWVVPQGNELQRWTVMARASASSARSRIAFLHSSGAGIQGELLAAYRAPVVVAIGADGGEDERIWQEALTGFPLVLLYCEPQIALMRAMREGRSTAEAMNNWARSARCVLAAFHADPERVVLIDAERALASPAAFVLACRQQFGMKIPLAELGTMETRSIPCAEEELYCLLAQHMVSRSEEASRLSDELSECALPMGLRVAPEADHELILRDHQARLEREEKLAGELDRIRTRAVDLDERNEELEAANAALYRQLRGMQEVLDTALQTRPETEGSDAAANEGNERTETIVALKEELADLEAERAQTQILISRLEDEIDTLRSGRRRLEEDQELVGLQLAQTQEELELTSLQVQELRLSEAARISRIDELDEALTQAKQRQGGLKRKLEQAERLLALRERRLSYMENSRSWRMTSVLRGAVQRFRSTPERKIAP